MVGYPESMASWNQCRQTNNNSVVWYAYVTRFKAAKAPLGLTRDVFVAELHAKRLVDVDIPRTTGLLHREPLYNKPHELLPHLYPKDFSLHNRDNISRFDEAQGCYDEAMKLPVYATADGQAATDRYVNTILDVATAWMNKA